MDAFLDLTEEELDRLDHFLLMVEEESIPTLSQLDGFLAAAAIFPDAYKSEDLLQAVFGEGMPCFASPEQREEIVSLVMRRYRYIEMSLRSKPPTYQPILDEDIDGSWLGEIWAEGFIQSAALRLDLWTDFLKSPAGGAVFLPFMALRDPAILARIEPRKRERSQLAAGYSEHIATYVVGAHRIACMTPLERAEAWAQMEEVEAETRAEAAALAQIDPSGSKIGRNEPCPCGSGKKFKRCCGTNL